MANLDEVRKLTNSLLGELIQNDYHITDKVKEAGKKLEEAWDSSQFQHERSCIGNCG